MHLKQTGSSPIQISAYELLDETETKTLGKMKDCFISACAAAPCILIVESIDALMQSTQPLEPGKGINHMFPL